MTLPVQITFRNMEADEELRELVQKEADALERFFPKIISCRVAVRAPSPKDAGGLYRVRIDTAVPGHELVVRHTPTLHTTLSASQTLKKTKGGEIQRRRQAPARAVREAFREMRRRLQDKVRKIRGRVKEHEPTPAGRVTKLFPDMDYGFLEAHDAREIYFHRNSVLDGHFDHLRVGSDVHFVEEPGEQGPQASTVRLVHPTRQLRAAAKTVPLAKKKAAKGRSR